MVFVYVFTPSKRPRRDAPMSPKLLVLPAADQADLEYTLALKHNLYEWLIEEARKIKAEERDLRERLKQYRTLPVEPPRAQTQEYKSTEPLL